MRWKLSLEPLHDSLHRNSIAITCQCRESDRRHDAALSPARHARSEFTAQNASILSNDDECTRCSPSRRGGPLPVAPGGDVPDLVHGTHPAAPAHHAQPRCVLRLLEAAHVGRERDRLLRVPAAARPPALAAPRPDRGGPACHAQRPWSARARRGPRTAPEPSSRRDRPRGMVPARTVSWLALRRCCCRCGRAAH